MFWRTEYLLYAIELTDIPGYLRLTFSTWGRILLMLLSRLWKLSSSDRVRNHVSFTRSQPNTSLASRSRSVKCFKWGTISSDSIVKRKYIFGSECQDLQRWMYKVRQQVFISFCHSICLLATCVSRTSCAILGCCQIPVPNSGGWKGAPPWRVLWESEYDLKCSLEW